MSTAPKATGKKASGKRAVGKKATDTKAAGLNDADLETETDSNSNSDSLDGRPRTVEESIYDHPKYYDLVFGADVAAETRFILQCTDEYASPSRKGADEWFFEPACGTGRLIYALLRKGYPAFGLDLNPKAVAFCNQRLKRHGFDETAIVADMCDFQRSDFKGILPASRRKDGPAKVAFNTINSFRHVGSEKESRQHLECMADMVRPGGIYLLGVHLTPTEAEPSDGEAWAARRGHLAINTQMWEISRDKKKRLECFGICFDIHTPRDSFRISDVLRLRSYTPKQMNSLIAHSGKWETVATYDFAYDFDYPIEVDATTEDVVYVLRRK
ncbi:class I SAM-dependent methyltransferase [Neorhodopirellula lusitana]|uniref:class I SAM-dependent methyltransferase n=1 Tax=Neorhodopirellula lusitana TaxID=445327 RepID=UPI00384EF1FA